MTNSVFCLLSSIIIAYCTIALIISSIQQKSYEICCVFMECVLAITTECDKYYCGSAARLKSNKTYAVNFSNNL